MSELSQEILPPPLPEELQDWKYLPLELFRKPWDHYAPFLAAHGYILAHTPEYDLDPRVETAPRKPPKDSFHPSDDEDFLYRLSLSDERKRLAQEGFFQQRSTGYLALDRQYRNVYIKAVPRSSSEWDIMQFLSTDPLRADPRNHTIPQVRILMAGEWIFTIQAAWSPYWDHPPLDTLQTRLEMARQLLEGLTFMHENGVGHGDIHCENILWNHDNARGLHVTLVSGQPAVPFHSTFRFCFAFIDFGSAVRFSADATDHLVNAEHIPPSHFAAPEQSQSEPYDIFASDVFNVGRVLQTELEEAKEKGSLAAINTPRLIPPYVDLLQSMTKSEPCMRPRAAEALESLITIIADLPACVDGNAILETFKPT